MPTPDPSRLPLALVQMTSTSRRAENLDRAEHLVRASAGHGAKLVALPENFSYLRSPTDPPPTPEPLDGPIVARFGRVAREHDLWLLLGSIPETSDEPGRHYNTSVLLRPDGTVAGAYRKIHLFDVRIADEVEHRESQTVVAGSEVVVVGTPWGRAGLSICYDLRFPELYRAMVRAGARLLFAPSAFTAATGRPHWEVLVRARAIENQCVLIAPAQAGRHSAERASHGHSCVVSPWGEILAEQAEREGFFTVTVDMRQVDQVRADLPCLEHARPWLLGETPSAP